MPFGVTAAIHSVIKNDWISIRPAVISYSVFGSLQLVNLVRYPEAKGLDRSASETWVYVLFLISIVLVGLFGVFQTRKHRRN